MPKYCNITHKDAILHHYFELKSPMTIGVEVIYLQNSVLDLRFF